MKNLFDNSYNKMQAVKILSMYGLNVNNTLVKSEDDHQLIKKAMDETFPDMIEKGIISDSLVNGYGVNQPLKFSKTGKELKEKIPSVISTLNAEKAALEVQMNMLKTQIGIEPTYNYTSYNLPNISMLRYDWALCDRTYNELTKQYDEPTEQNTLCNQYNSLAGVCMNIIEDIACLQVISANVEDGKKYELSVNQLVALSFN